MAVAELERFRQKYPQYEDMDDLALAQRLSEKYPQYSDLLEKVQSEGASSEDDFSLAKGVRQAATGYAGGVSGGLTDVVANKVGVPQSDLRDLAGVIGMLSPGGLAGRAVKLGKSAVTSIAPRAMESLAGRMAVRGAEGALGAGATQLGEAIEEKSPMPILQAAGMGGAIGAAAPPIYSGFGKTLEMFGLKKPKSFPINPTVDDLAQMAPTDRQMYMQIQRQGIQSKFQSRLTGEQNRLRAAGEQLNSQLEFAGKEAVLKARPALAQVMGKASPTWRRLVQESLNEADDIGIMPSEIAEELSKKFGQDQNLIQRALQEIDVDALARREADFVTGASMKPYSAKEVFGKLMQERLDISPKVRAGDAVMYGERDFFKDSVVESLTNILHRKGLDFSKANQFWAPYAQLRNSLFRAIKPFKSEPFETESGSRLFQAAARGKGKAAEVSALEQITGQDFTSGLKDIVSRQEDIKGKLRELPKAIQEEKRFSLGELTRKGLEAKGKATERSQKISRNRKIGKYAAVGTAGVLGVPWLRKALGL